MRVLAYRVQDGVSHGWHQLRKHDGIPVRVSEGTSSTRRQHTRLRVRVDHALDNRDTPQVCGVLTQRVGNSPRSFEGA